MADDNEIQISITLDDGSVRQGFARIQQSGEDAGKSLSDAFSQVKTELLALLGAYVGFEAAKKFVEESIDAAAAYDKALNDMNKSLFAAGGYSQAASEQFLGFAESMEKSTTLSTKQVLSLEALANNYAHTNEQALKLTQAAIELGAATGKGPNAALQQLGQTLEGNAGRLTKLLPQVQNFTKYQLEQGAALDLVTQRFKGAAEGDVNTYEGAIARLNNSFENLKIAFGEIVTQSPAVRAAIQFISNELNIFADYIKSLNTTNFMKNLIDSSIEFGQAFNDVVITPIEIFYNVAKTVFTAVETAITAVIASIAGVAGDIISIFSSSSPLAEALHGFAEQADIATASFADDTVENFKKIGDVKFADGVGQELTKLKVAVDSAKPFQQLHQDMFTVREDLTDFALRTNGVVSSFNDMKNGVVSAAAEMVQTSSKLMQQLGATAIKSLGGGFAQAMAAVGKAAVEGKDIFKAFAGAMISALGSALIQMGTGYIMLGLAREIASYGADPTGYELIGIGSGMAVLGGALEAVGGQTSGASSTSSPSSSGGGGSSSSGSSGPVAASSPAQNVQPKAQVTVNVQGSVFDTHETAMRIVDLVNQAVTGQGAQVLTGS